MKIEDLTKDEVKKGVGIIKNPDYSSVIEPSLNGQSLQHQFEDFYGLSYYKRIETIPREIAHPIRLHTTEYNKREEETEKTGQVPTSLIQTLDEFNQEKIIGNIVPDTNELVYENVREAVNYPNPTPPGTARRKIMGLAGILTMCTGIGLAKFTGDSSLLIKGLFLAIGGSGLGYYEMATGIISSMKERRPKNVQNRKKAFLELYENSKKLDTVIDNYRLLMD